MHSSRSPFPRGGGRLMLSLVLAAASLCLSPVLADLTWTQLPSGLATPGIRSSAAFGFLPLSNMLELFGGNSPAGSLDDTWLYDLTTESWEQVIPSDESQPWPSPRWSMVTGVLTSKNLYTANTSLPGEAANEALVVATGIGGPINNEVWKFTIGTRRWEFVNAMGDIPKTRYGAVGGIWPGSTNLILSHGFGAVRYSDAFSLDLNTELWTKVHGTINPYEVTAPHPRCLASGTLLTAGSLMMYGGCQQGGQTGGTCPARDGWVMDFVQQSSDASGKWDRKSEAPSPRTQGSMGRVPRDWLDDPYRNYFVPNFAFLIGGYEDGQGKQVITVTENNWTELPMYNANDNTWYSIPMMNAELETNGPGWRNAPSTCTDDDGGKVYMFGGVLRDVSPSQHGEGLWQLSDDITRIGAVQGVTPVLRMVPMGTSYWFLYPHLHGVFMGIAYGLIFPLGFFMARYNRHNDPQWFILHRSFQTFGFVLAVIGFVVVFVGGAANPAFAHGIIGIIAFALTLAQVVMGFARPKHGSKYRTAFEWFHKGSGYLTILLGLVNVSLGTMLIQGPDAVWIAWYCILGVMFAITVVLEVLMRMKGGQPKPKEERDSSSPSRNSDAENPGAKAESNGAISGTPAQASAQ